MKMELEITFPFHKLRYEKYLTLEVMIYVEHPQALKFMFSVNKKCRRFLQEQYIPIQNGCINEGLICYWCSDDFDSYERLEKIYFEALTRNPCNRKLTLSFDIWDYFGSFPTFKQVVEWIKEQKQSINL